MSTGLALIALIAGACCSVLAWSLPDAPAAGPASLVATGLGLLGAAVGAVSLRRRRASIGELRWLAYVAALVAIGQIVFGGAFALGAFLLRFGASMGLMGLTLPARDRLAVVLHSPPVRIGDLLLGSLLVLGIGGELGLRLFAWLAPSPLFERPATSPADRIKMHALSPGAVRFGFPASPEGFYDVPFERAPDGHAVLVVGGSSSVGLVPHSLLYSTVAERGLSDTAVWNCGVLDTGPVEYLHLLQTVGLPLGPDRAIVAIEVADDFRDAAHFDEDRPVHDLLAGWLDARNLLLAVVPERIATLLAERSALGRDPRQEAFGAGERITGDVAIAERFPWTRDPSLEQPSRADEAWLARVRAQLADDSATTADSGLFRALDACRSACDAAGVRFAMVVLPAAWQVDEALWRSIAGELEPAARDRPQRLMNAWAMRNGVPILDVLPFLRATPPMSDGKRHLFHRNDDRLNSRGNRLVGDALAGFIKRWRGEENR